jgi:hypothetical protein
MQERDLWMVSRKGQQNPGKVWIFRGMPMLYGTKLINFQSKNDMVLLAESFKHLSYGKGGPKG